MSKGEVVAIFIRPEAGQPTQQLNQVRAVPGKGLEGDYYFQHQNNNLPKPPDVSREVTFIEIETLQALERDYGIALKLGDSRRNLVTRNVPLNHFIDKEFQVGEVTLKGIRLCEPCSHLGELTQEEVQKALLHRGGLRAQILTEGILRVGDVISSPE